MANQKVKYQTTWVRPLWSNIFLYIHINTGSDTSQNHNKCTPLGSVRRRAVIRWPVCIGWPRGSRRPLPVHRTSSPGRVLEQRTAGSHRKCPAYSPQWTHYWSQSRRSWCSYLRLTTGSPPEVGERWGKSPWGLSRYQHWQNMIDYRGFSQDTHGYYSGEIRY